MALEKLASGCSTSLSSADSKAVVTSAVFFFSVVISRIESLILAACRFELLICNT